MSILLLCDPLNIDVNFVRAMVVGTFKDNAMLKCQLWLMSHLSTSLPVSQGYNNKSLDYAASSEERQINISTKSIRLNVFKFLSP